MRTGGATFSVHRTDTAASDHGAIVYFECDNVDSKVEELLNHGYQFDQLPRDEPWLWREARLRDPSNNVLCLYRAGKIRRFPHGACKTDRFHPTEAPQDHLSQLISESRQPTNIRGCHALEKSQDISGPCFDEYYLAKAPSSQSWICRPLRALRLGVRLFELTSHATEAPQNHPTQLASESRQPTNIRGCHALEKSQDISGPCFDEYCLAKAPSSQSWMCRPLRALRLGVRLFELTDPCSGGTSDHPTQLASESTTNKHQGMSCTGEIARHIRPLLR